MGSSWISVVSLTVLVLTSYLTNMKANNDTSSATQDATTDSTETYPTEVSTNKLPTDNTGTRDPAVNNSTCVDYKDQAQTSDSSKNSTSETSNCTFVDHATTEFSSVEMISSSTITAGKKTVSYRDFPEYTHYRNLGRVAPYITTVPGFITNSITILVAVRIKPLHTSEIYMILLGCADLLTVTGRFTFRVLERYLETDSDVHCKIIGYIFTAAQVYSNLILVSWTIERFIAVMFPIKLASWCSVRNTVITAILLLLFCVATTIPYITEMNLINIWNGQQVSFCYFSEFMNAVWVHIESVYYLYIPVMLVFICNIIILCRLSSMTKARIKMASNQETIEKKTIENRKMTILLLTISSTFMLLHIQYAVVMVFNYIYPDIMVMSQEDPHAFAKYLLFSNCGIIVTEYQNSINFFLYCISGTKFRLTFFKLFCRLTPIKTSETVRSRSPTYPEGFCIR